MKYLAIVTMVSALGLSACMDSTTKSDSSGGGDCSPPNLTNEGGLLTGGAVYRASKLYPNTKKNAAFESVLGALASSGYQIVSKDKSRGLISASSGSVIESGPVNVVISRAGGGIKVDTSSTVTPGLISNKGSVMKTFCHVYASIR